MDPAFHQLCSRYSGTSTPTAPTAIRLWETFTFYIRTEWVRYLFIASSIRKKFLCNKVLRKQHMNNEVFYVTYCSFLHNLEQRLSVFARCCVEKIQHTWKYMLANGLLQKAMRYMKVH